MKSAIYFIDLITAAFTVVFNVAAAFGIWTEINIWVWIVMEDIIRSITFIAAIFVYLVTVYEYELIEQWDKASHTMGQFGMYMGWFGFEKAMYVLHSSWTQTVLVRTMYCVPSPFWCSI